MEIFLLIAVVIKIAILFRMIWKDHEGKIELERRKIFNNKQRISHDKRRNYRNFRQCNSHT